MSKSPDVLEAAARVQAFLDGRKAYRSRLDPSVTRPLPDRIIAQYGYLDVGDLQAIVDAVLRPA